LRSCFALINFDANLLVDLQNKENTQQKGGKTHPFGWGP